MTKLQIFQPKLPEFTVTPNVIVYSLVAVTGSLYALDELLGLSIPYSAPLLGTLTAITVVLMLIFNVTSLANYKPLNGAFSGNLLLMQDVIEFNGNRIHLEEVKQVDFFIGDFYGRIPIGGNYANFNPVRSQGVANFMEITYNGLEKQKIYFKLQHKQDYRTLFPLIEEWMKKSKISFLRGIELLEISDYDEIQEFKKRITATNKAQASVSARPRP